MTNMNFSNMLPMFTSIQLTKSKSYTYHVDKQIDNQIVTKPNVFDPSLCKNIKPKNDKHKYCTMEYVLNTDTTLCPKCGFELHLWYDK